MDLVSFTFPQRTRILPWQLLFWMLIILVLIVKK
jgi:hypothetical protein